MSPQSFWLACRAGPNGRRNTCSRFTGRSRGFFNRLALAAGVSVIVSKSDGLSPPQGFRIFAELSTPLVNLSLVFLRAGGRLSAS
jgi:hypothetical protein